MSIFIQEIALEGEESLKIHEKKGHHGWIKVTGMASGALWRMCGGEGAFFFFFLFAEFGARRGGGKRRWMMFKGSQSPTSELLEVRFWPSYWTFSFNSPFWYFLSPYPPCPGLLTVFGMTHQPCPLDSFSFCGFHDNGTSGFSWWVFITSFASSPLKLFQ